MYIYFIFTLVCNILCIANFLDMLEISGTPDISIASLVLAVRGDKVVAIAFGFHRARNLQVAVAAMSRISPSSSFKQSYSRKTYSTIMNRFNLLSKDNDLRWLSSFNACTILQRWDVG